MRRRSPWGRSGRPSVRSTGAVRRRGPLAIVVVAVLALALPIQPPIEETLPLEDPMVTLGTEPPRCRYADVLTKYRTYNRHDVTLLDTIYRVTAAYAPGDLVAVTSAGLAGAGSVRRVVLADLRALATAARIAGAPLRSVSAYRSYAQQASTFNYWVSVAGYQRALLASARPGHSEHQLGTSLDFASRSGPDPWKLADWATTKAGGWMLRNAWRHGFVLSYPKGSSPSITCYKYEPWHYRWVGRTRAAEIRRAGITPRQYIWRYQ